MLMFLSRRNYSVNPINSRRPLMTDLPLGVNQANACLIIGESPKPKPLLLRQSGVLLTLQKARADGSALRNFQFAPSVRLA